MNTINKVYDAHIHIPIKFEEPLDVLRSEIKRSGITGGLLIINTKEEADVFWRNVDNILYSSLGFVPDIAYILDVHARDWIEPFERLEKKQIKYAIKIHPRVSNITREDFELVNECIRAVQANNIIVDNWIYGPRIENHIGTQLSISVAEAFAEKTIIMAHAGGVRLLETMLLTRPIKNLYYDLSETCQYFKNTSVYTDLIHFIKFTCNRIMFGSDFPDFSISESITKMEELLSMAEISEQESKNIMHVTAEKIYRGGVIRKIVEKCDHVFLIGLSKRNNYEDILQKMIDNAEFVIVKYDDELAGYASMYANDHIKKIAYISMFGILEQFQGRGLGSYLMSECCRLAKENGMDSVTLEVLKANQKALMFYEKYGFIKTNSATKDSLFLQFDLN